MREKRERRSGVSEGEEGRGRWEMESRGREEMIVGVKGGGGKREGGWEGPDG